MTLRAAQLDCADIHVWTVQLDDGALDALATSLSAREQATAQRLHSAALQARWRRGRGALRAVLGGFLGCHASTVEISYGAYGKPLLGQPGLHFNMSHSGERALIGVSREPLGIDIERADDSALQLDSLIGMIAHPAERAAYMRLQRSERAACFFGLWTRKEAYVKAIGTGLQTALTDCQLVPDERASHRVCDSRGAALGWHTHDLDAGQPLWQAAVCSALAAPRISIFHDQRFGTQPQAAPAFG